MAQKKEKAAGKKAAKKDRKGSEAEGEEYEFPMPEFDEQAFMRREMESAKTAFVAAAIGLVAGLLAYLLHTNVGEWRLGFLLLFALCGILGGVLKKLGFSEEATSAKSLFGNWFLLFFTGFAVWVLALNI